MQFEILDDRKKLVGEAETLRRARSCVEEYAREQDDNGKCPYRFPLRIIPTYGPAMDAVLMSAFVVDGNIRWVKDFRAEQYR